MEVGPEKNTKETRMDSPRFADLGAYDLDRPGGLQTRAGAPVEVLEPEVEDVQIINGIRVEPGTPLAYLIKLVKADPNPDWSPEQKLYHEALRLKAAAAALPAIHPRLSQVTHGGKVTLSHEDALAALSGGPEDEDGD